MWHRRFACGWSTAALGCGGTVVSEQVGEQFKLSCRVNGQAVDVAIDQDETLLWMLRERLGLTGTKGSCLEGECGSCTVLVDGQAVNSCLSLAAQMQGRVVETIEGLANGDKLHVLQDKFLASGAAQCGYCTPGLIMAAKALLETNPSPTEQEFFEGMEGNICRCTGYAAICEAIRGAAREWDMKRQNAETPKHRNAKTSKHQDA